MTDLPTGIPAGYFSGSNGGKCMSQRAKPKITQPTLDVDDSAVADRIREALENVDLTRREVADAVQVGEKVIHSWARLGQISKHKLPRFAEVTGTTVDFLLTGRRPHGQVYERSKKENVVEFSRTITDQDKGISKYSVRDIPMIEVVDLLSFMPEKSVNGTDNTGLTILDGVMMDWAGDQSNFTSVPIALWETTGLGLPKFAIQLTTYNWAPIFNIGTMLAYAVDIIPTRGDFAMIARRRKNDYWSIGTGFFRFTQSEAWMPSERFLTQISKKDLGYKMELHSQPTGNPGNDAGSPDPFCIDCYHDEWLLIGVAVHHNNWLFPRMRLTQTRLGQRLEERISGRGRYDSD